MAIEKTIENFLDAMNIIATHQATELQNGDQTRLCTIVDDSRAEKESRYTVSDGSARFDVFDNINEAGKKKYKVKDQVYVIIPQGDYNKQKFIQGPYMTDTDLLPITYVSPLDSFLDMATLTDNQVPVSGSLRSNGDKLEVLLWDMDFRSNPEYADLQKNNVYDTLGLQASFKCLLDDFNMRSGSYGLRLDLAVRLTPTSSRTVRKSIYLDSSEFFGNPYAFTLFSPQAQTYDISSLGIVDGIALTLYQNDDFTHFNGSSVERINPDTIEDNIFVTNIYVALGSEISKVTDNTVKLYTDDELTYSYTDPSDINNSKTLGFLWYNKTEENQYIGFSDGLVSFDDNGNFVHYDELEYMKEAATEQRLLDRKSTDVPKDKNGLEVAANWYDAHALLNKIESYLEKDLTSHLKSFESRVNGVMVDGKSMGEYFRHDTDGKITKITKAHTDIKTWHNDLNKYFPKALKAAAEIQKHQEESTSPTTEVEIKSENIYSNDKLGNIFTKTIKPLLLQTEEDINYIFNDLRVAIRDTYPSFQNGYDIWSNKVNLDIEALEKMFTELHTLLDGLEARATSSTKNIQSNSTFKYTYGTTIGTYAERDFSDWDNKYCVYWYRYDAKATDVDGIMGNGWVRMKPGVEIQSTEKNKITMPNNLGLSTTYKLVEQVNKFDPKPTYDEGLLQVYLDRNKKKEKFKVAVFYNHEMFESNELEFENTDDILDLSYINVSDEIEIRHGQDSHDGYQTLYAASNSLSNPKEAKIQRQLSVHYRGLMGDDELLSGAEVFWYVPRNATMLNVDVNKLKDLGFSTDYYRTARVKEACSSYRGPSNKYEEVKDYAEGATITAVYDKADGYYSLKETNAKGVQGEWIQESNLEIIDDKEIYRDGFACFYKNIGYTEVPMTDEKGNKVQDADGNDVMTKSVNVEDQKFQYQINEYFTPTALNNTIFCVVKYAEEYSFENSKTFLFGQQGTTGTDYTISITPAGAQAAVKPDDPLELMVKAFDFNNIEMDINVKSAVTETKKPEICNPQFNWLGDLTAFDAVSTPTSGTIINDFEVKYRDSSKHYGILQFNADLYNSTHGKVIQLTNYYPIPSSDDQNNNYYIEGPTTIVYDNQGANPVYYKKPFKIFNAATGQEVNDCKWSITHYLKDGKTFSVIWEEVTKNGKTTRVRKATGTGDAEEINFYATYAPYLNSDNSITPAAIYISDETQGQDGLPFYSVVSCESGGINIWYQPLVIYQNRYPNSMINNWDGSFKIDEENGTILSQMVGAGLKNSDNTFSGILMGNVEGAAEDNSTGLGIYGYHHGAQSLNLSVDGTAFFGKSGRGRIYFDGNSGTISSASYQQNREDKGVNKSPSTAGMMIDLDDGFIDMLGTTEFSETTDWNSYTGDKKGHTKYAEYKKEYGALYKDDGTNSHIRLDVNSPYFQITSQSGNRLLHVGSDDETFPLFTSGTYPNYQKTVSNFEKHGKGYYIKSDNYAPTLFSLDDKVKNENGAGMLIDLNSGRIDAYDLKLFSKNLFIDSGAEDTFFMLKDNDGCILLRAGDDDLLIKSHSYTVWETPEEGKENKNSPGIRLAFGTNTAKPYVNIRGKESSIFYVAENSYYIQTDGYSDSGKTGARINLTNGSFNLMGYSSEDQYSGSYVKISSSPQIQMYLKEFELDDDGKVTTTIKSQKTLLNVSPSTFLLQSPKWTKSGTDETKYGGMQINMMTPKIEMWKLGEGKGIYIDASRSRSDWPIQIGDPYDNDKNLNLRIGWDGSLQGGKIGKNAEEWYIKADGSVSFKKGYIGGWTIGVSSLSGEGKIEGGTIDGSYIYGSTIDGGSLSIAGGKLTANSKGVSVSGSITCSSLNIATEAFTFNGKDVKLTQISYLSDVAKGIIPGYNGTKIVACEGVDTTSDTITIDGTSYTFITSVKARGVSTYTFYDGKLNVIGYW